MKTNQFVSLLLALSAGSAKAQDFSVLHAGKRTVFQADASRVAVIATDAQAVIARPELQESQAKLPDGWSQIRRASIPSTTTSLTSLVRSRMTEQLRHPKVAFAAPVLKTPEGDEVVPTPAILVKLKSGQDVGAFLRAKGISSVVSSRKISPDGIHSVETSLRDGAAVMDLAANLAARTEVKLAVPNFLRQHRQQRLATDPDFASFFSGTITEENLHSWGLQRMDANRAWDVTTGQSSVLVAVFDGGIQQDHPEINQVPGISTSLLQPANGDADPAPAVGHDHGTMVASCVSGRMDNGIGACGIAPNARSISVRFCTPVMFPGAEEPVMFGLDSDIVTGLVRAQLAGARITVHSYSWPWASPAVVEAFAVTRANGMIHFASAGNDAEEREDFASNPSIGYPASDPSVLCVGASGFDDLRAPFSQFGRSATRSGSGVDFLAPGTLVGGMGRTGVPGKSDTRAELISGTSFAAPYAAGSAALILSKNPELTVQQVESLMIAGCKDLGTAGWDRETGFGRLNAFSSLPDDHSNNVVNATRIEMDSIIRGHVNRSTDKDCLRFTLTDHAIVNMHTVMVKDQPTTEQVTVELLNSNGSNATFTNLTPTNASEISRLFPGSSPASFRLRAAMAPGTYVARISGVSSTIGTYDFTINQERAYPEITVLGSAVIQNGDRTPSTSDGSDFGTVSLGGSVTRTFTIQNDGHSFLRISNANNIDGNRNLNPVVVETTPTGTPRAIPIPGITPQPTPIHFRATTSPSSVILPGRITRFKVTFKPVGTGVFSHTIRIASNDEDEGVFEFTVSGRCIFKPRLNR